MDEFAALAQRVVLTMDDVRGCLVLSRDGLVLGAFPEDREAELKPAWLRFVHVGEARKGFVEFSDQLWAFVHRGPYAAFVVTGTSVRPGVMLDQLEQAVIAAEESRAKQKEVTLKVPDAASAPSGRPRTSLHPPADRPAAAPVASAPAANAEELPSFAAPTASPEEAAGAAAYAAPAGDATALEMQEMREQMAAMKAELDLRAQPAAAKAAEAAAPPAVAPPRGQPLSGYRRPEQSAAPPATVVPPPEAAPPVEVPEPRSGADLSAGARPSIEGTTYETTLPEDRSSGFASESSPFARLDTERAAAEGQPAETAPPAASPAAVANPAATETAEAPQDATAFGHEPQRLVSAEQPTPEEAPAEQEDPPEVDRVMLAKEFSGLLQVGEDGDED